jgi:hypothetical protein
MADKKLRIPRKLKTETLKQLKIRTDMNSDAPYESAVRTSLIVFSFLGIRNFLSAIKYLSFCHVILVYLYHILLSK